MIAVCAEVVGDMIGKLAAQVPGELFFSLHHDMGFFLSKQRPRGLHLRCSYSQEPYDSWQGWDFRETVKGNYPLVRAEGCRYGLNRSLSDHDI